MSVKTTQRSADLIAVCKVVPIPNYLSINNIPPAGQPHAQSKAAGVLHGRRALLDGPELARVLHGTHVEDLQQLGD